MNYDKSIEPVTEFKTKSAKLIKRARESRQPIIITQNGRATAVLQDIDSYQSQRQALLLLKFMSQGEKEIREGKGIPHDKALKLFERFLGKERK